MTPVNPPSTSRSAIESEWKDGHFSRGIDFCGCRHFIDQTSGEKTALVTNVINQLVNRKGGVSLLTSWNRELK